MKKSIFYLLLLSLLALSFSACTGSEVEEYSIITFDKNNDAATGSMKVQVITSLSSPNLTPNEFKFTGMKLACWNTSSNGNGTSYDNEAVFPSNAGKITLYAQWILGDYSITFEKNNSLASGTMPNQTITNGSSKNLSTCAFTSPGRVFSSWNTVVDGSGTAYSDAASFTMSTSNVVLYAQWGWETFALRDTGPAGGLIFYINPNAATDGWKYLESSTNNLTSGLWGSSAYSIDTYDHTVGSGKQNTLEIIANDPTPNKAADKCANYTIIKNGITFNDWYLPSVNELKHMYTNLRLQGVGNFDDHYYWSSNERDYSNDDNAYMVHFDHGSSATTAKASAIYRIRAIRSF